jgi:hypothetical protein
VIQIEQHRALHQNAAKVSLRDFHRSELPLIVRFLSGRKLSKLNRQIPELQYSVTCRNQTTETCSNRRKFQKRLRRISHSTSLVSARDFASGALRRIKTPAIKNAPFLQTGHATSNRKWAKSRCYRKQKIKPSLTEARTAFRETAFGSNLLILGAALSQGFRPSRQASCAFSKRLNLSRSHGRP